MVWKRKEALHAGRLPHLPQAVELRAVVQGDRLELQAAGADQLKHSAIERTHRAMWQPYNPAKACCPLRQRQKSAALPHRAHDGIALPMTGLLPEFDHSEPCVDQRLIGQFSTLFRAIRAFAAMLPALPQAPEHRPSGQLVAPHMPVDRHVTQPHSKLFGQRAGDLLRAPLRFGQERLDVRINPRFRGALPVGF